MPIQAFIKQASSGAVMEVDNDGDTDNEDIGEVNDIVWRHRPVMWSFGVFCDVSLDKLLNN